MSSHLIPAARLPGPRRPPRAAAMASFLLHAGVLVAVIAHGRAMLDGMATGGRGDRGASAVQFFTLPAASPMGAVELPAPPRVAPPLVSLPDARIPALEPVSLPVLSPSAFATPASGAVPGGATLASDRAGGAEGDAGGSGSGADGRYISRPSPRGVIVPPENPPTSVRGRAYLVRFWVNAEGRVDRIAVTPEIADDRYRRDFHQSMLNYRFYPAKTRDGWPVAGVIAIGITIGITP